MFSHVNNPEEIKRVIETFLDSRIGVARLIVPERLPERASAGSDGPKAERQ